MLLESYFIYQQCKKYFEQKKLKELQNQNDKIKFVSQPTFGQSVNQLGQTLNQTTNTALSTIQPFTQPFTSAASELSPTTALILLIVMIIVGLLIVIFGSYMMYKCIRSHCLGFLAVILIILFINVPILNIFIIIYLMYLFFTQCKGEIGCMKVELQDV